LAALLGSLALSAQDSLSLPDAIRVALEKHPAILAGRSATRAAEFGEKQAKAGMLPKLNYSESWTGSNNPVFVFSSLLTQRQFTASNFDIDRLNRPGWLNNFQSLVVAEQPLYDAGQTRLAHQSAMLGRDMTREQLRRTQLDVMARVVRAYYGAVLGAQLVKVAGEAVRSAEADLARAKSVRDAGMSTDADVLSIEVHLAAMREQEIRRRADEEVARAALNEAMGLPLDTPHTLTTALEAVQAAPVRSREDYLALAATSRPELLQSRLAIQMAQTQIETARTSLLPQVVLRAAFEADRQRFVTRGGANWLTGVSLRWNLFNGFADRARIDEASERLVQSRSLERQVTAGIQLEQRKAEADRRAAEERVRVAQAAVAQAEESLRIIKNRFEAGMTNVTELLRAETALLDASTRKAAAIHDLRLARIGEELAAGSLSPDSEVLK
jgi:outer membrane protein TolC